MSSYYTTNYYDDKLRSIESIRNLYPTGTHIASCKYDFVSNLLQSKEYQHYNTNTETVDKYYSYDHRGRLLKIEESHDGGINKQQLSEMKYDALGRLESKELHDGIETTNYSYNIRNWLTSMHGGKFKMDLFYNKIAPFTALVSNAKAQYNGNVSAISWQNNTGVKQAYAFNYDGISRITGANYLEGTTLARNNKYDVSGVRYDKNGNILSLQRKQESQIVDALSYSYNGNKLKYVNDTGNKGVGFKELSTSTGTSEYTYDANGNMIKDLNAGIMKGAYNFLNLPQEIIKGGKTIKYIYTATGEKLQNILPNKTITYCGGFVYEGIKLAYVQNEEGRYVVNGETASYEYNLTDHLGNVRMVLNGKGEIVQTSNYYPFGMRFGISGGSDNKNLYNGKELQEETDWLDFGARMYDSSIGRWMCADPMAEKACDWTPYRYCFNNPMNMIDPNGLYEWDYDMGSNNISYVGDMGGKYLQFVNNLDTGLQMTMDNSTFESYFGLDPANWEADELKGEDWDAAYYGGDIQEYKNIVDYNSRNFSNRSFASNGGDRFIDVEFSLSLGFQSKTKLKVFGVGWDLSGNIGKLGMMNWSAASNKKGVVYTPYKSITSSVSLGALGLYGGYKRDWGERKNIAYGQLGLISKEQGKQARLNLLEIGNAFFFGYDLKVTVSPTKLMNVVGGNQVERANRISRGDWSMWAYPRFGGRTF